MSEQSNNGEFHPADPAYRRRIQLLLALVLVLVVVELVAVNTWLMHAARHLTTTEQFADRHALHYLLAVPSLLLGVFGALVAARMFRLARDTFAARRWPPNGTRSSVDVRIRYLTAAESIAVQVRAGAIALAVLSAGLLAFFAWLLWSG
ncbi:MAG: hypothetical protein ABI588_03115 [Arenimonas sp.]